MKLDDYDNFTVTKLPFISRGGFQVTNVVGMCGSCDGKLTGMKSRINDFGNSIEIMSVGICHECRTIVDCKKVRRYNDGRIAWYDDGGGWVEGGYDRTNWWEYITNKIHGIFR